VLEVVTVGDPMDPTNEIGPPVAECHRDRVEGYIRSGIDDGVEVMFGGGRPKDLDKGWYIEPTLFVNANNDMKMCHGEIFGPVGTMIPCGDVDEAVELANDTNYGLAGAVFTGDPERGHALAGRIRAGKIGANSLDVSSNVPFGGYKDSGVGRAHGPESFAELFATRRSACPPATCRRPDRVPLSLSIGRSVVSDPSTQACASR
jgi:aldehyde dehydrogenase (NAD+)